MYSCHLFLISSTFVRSIPFLHFIVFIFAWNIPLVSLIFLKKYLVFPILLFSSISLYWSLRKAFLSLPAILWNPAFKWVYLSFFPLLYLLFFSQLFVRPPQTTILPFCIYFSCGWSWALPPVQCHESLSIDFQALCLSDLIPWIYLSLTLYKCKGFDLGLSYLNALVIFLTFFNLSLNITIRKGAIWV